MCQKRMADFLPAVHPSLSFENTIEACDLFLGLARRVQIYHIVSLLWSLEGCCLEGSLGLLPLPVDLLLRSRWDLNNSLLGLVANTV